MAYILRGAIQPIECVLFASLSLSFSLSLQYDSAFMRDYRLCSRRRLQTWIKLGIKTGGNIAPTPPQQKFFKITCNLRVARDSSSIEPVGSLVSYQSVHWNVAIGSERMTVQIKCQLKVHVHLYHLATLKPAYIFNLLFFKMQYTWINNKYSLQNLPI